MKKHIIYITLLLFAFTQSKAVNANHILGGEITYKHITNKKYKVVVKVYRDCQECKFNGIGGGSSTENCQDAFDLVIYNLNNNRSYLDKIILKRDSFIDITPVCSSVTSSCQGTTGTNYGIEEHWLSCVVDFANYNACNFELGTQIYSRSNEIHQNQETQHYYNNATLNLCKVVQNNSALINAKPLQIIYLNEPVKYNIEATDIDGDSLSYELVKAKISPELFIQYPTNKSEKEPLTVHCPSGCTVNKSISPPTGLYFNETTGELVFTPSKLDESGIFVIQINEFRKVNGVMTKISEVRGDVQFYVANSSGNHPPKMLNDNFTFEICSGEDICIDFNATDAKNGVAYDTVHFTSFSDVNDYSFIENPSRNPPYYSSSYCWTPHDSFAREEPYYFTIKLEDNGCPMKKSSYYTFSVKVNKSVKANAKIENIGCGEVKLTSTSPEGDYYDNYWQIQDYKDSTLVYLFKNDTTWTAPKNGVYKYWFVHSNTLSGCNSTIRDSFEIKNISDLHVNLGPDIEQCKESSLTLSGNVYGAQGQVSYLWENGSTLASQEILVDSAMIKILSIKDENLCTSSDTIGIAPFKRLESSIDDQEVCYNLERLNLTNLFKGSSEAVSYHFKTYGFDTVALKFEQDSWYLDYSKFVAPKKYKLYLIARDNYSCSYFDSLNVMVADPPDVKFSEIRDICSNEEVAMLNRETQNDLMGTWKFEADLTRISNGDVLNLIGLNLNQEHTVNFYTNQKGCIVDRDFNFVLKEIPRIEITSPSNNTICRNGNSIELKGNIPNGEWNGEGVEDSIFNPILVKGNSSLISYYYKDETTGCANSDTLNMQVFELPKFAFHLQGDTICEGETSSVGFSYSNHQKIELSTNPNGLFGTGVNEVVFNHKSFPEVYFVQCFGVARNFVCPDFIDTFSLVINEKPKGKLLPNVLSGCEPLDVNFGLTNLNYPFTKLNTELIGINVVPNEMKALSLENGTYDYSLIADYHGCEDTFEFNGLEVYSTPQPDFSIYPELIFADNPVAYYKDLTQCIDPYVLYWDFNGKIDSSSYQEDIIIAYPKNIGEYYTRLTAQSNKGCEATVEKEVNVLPSRELYIPTAFTPNELGPLENEGFRIISSVIGNYKIKILNRWGEVLFTSTDINDSWDGTYNNKPCKPGVYAYKIVVERNDGYTKEYIGTVTLLRSGE